MTTLYKLLLIFLCFCSCSSSKTKDLNGNKPDSYLDSLIRAYPLTTLDPDTALSIFLWIDTLPNYDNSIEEYTRLFIEKDKQLKLLTELFRDYPRFEKTIEELEKRQIEFDKHMKHVVVENALKYGNLGDGREEWYLRQADIDFYDSLLKIYPQFKSETDIVE